MEEMPVLAFGHSIRQKYLRPDFNQLPLLPTTSRIALCHREIRKGAALTRGRPDGKALRSVSSSAAGPQNPAAGDTGSRSPSEGLPDDSFEISRTVAVGTGSCQSLGEEAITASLGLTRRLRPPIRFGSLRAASLQ